jgi:hypothetical protein
LLEITDGKEVRFVNIGSGISPIWLPEKTAMTLTKKQLKELGAAKTHEMFTPSILKSIKRRECLKIKEKSKRFPGYCLSEEEAYCILNEVEEQEKMASEATLKAKLESVLTSQTKEQQEFSLNLERDAKNMVVPFVKPKHDYCVGCKIKQTCDGNNPHCKEHPPKSKRLTWAELAKTEKKSDT